MWCHFGDLPRLPTCDLWAYPPMKIILDGTTVELRQLLIMHVMILPVSKWEVYMIAMM